MTSSEYKLFKNYEYHLGELHREQEKMKGLRRQLRNMLANKSSTDEMRKFEAKRHELERLSCRINRLMSAVEHNEEEIAWMLNASRPRN